MALGKCKECGGQVAKSAPSCPHCGAKQPKKTSVVTWLVLGTVVVVAANAMLSDPEPEPARPVLTAEQQAARAEQSRRDAVRTAHIMHSEKSVRARLKDPESAKFHDVTYRTEGFTCGFVNAKNSFGAMTGNRRFVSYGTVETTSMEDDPGFAKVWNSTCAKS